MPTTYEPIATTTIAGTTTSVINFTSIPNTYTDLRIIINHTAAPGGTSATAPIMQFNNTTTNYSVVRMIGDGSSASVTRQTSVSQINPDNSFGPSTTIPSLVTIDIFSYTVAMFKTCLMTANTDKNGSGAVVYSVGMWRSTDAITSIKLTSNGSNYGNGSTATLYGILKA